MSIHLIGGGQPDFFSPDIYGTFLEEATARALGTGRELARIALVVVGGDDEYAAGYLSQLERTAPCDPVVNQVAEGATLSSTALTDIDGLLVCGGHTPSYLEAIGPVTNEIRLLVSDGLPYAG